MSREDFGRFQTTNEKFKKILRETQSLALTLNPILIIGEPGVGRRELAIDIFEKSTRSNKKLSRLSFDHFAIENIDNTGTVIIENVNQLNPKQQEEIFIIIKKSFSQGLIKSPRWIATATQDILAQVREGDFSVGLYQALSSHQIKVPSLFERNGDIEFLIQAHVDGLNLLLSKNKKTNNQVIKKFENIRLKNNVQELQILIEKAFLKSADDIITLQHLGLNEMGSTALSQTGLSLSEMERRLIIQTLEMTNHNRTRAAEVLGISIRTLRNKINEYRGAEVI